MSGSPGPGLTESVFSVGSPQKSSPDCPSQLWLLYSWSPSFLSVHRPTPPLLRTGTPISASCFLASGDKVPRAGVSEQVVPGYGPLCPCLLK